MQQTLMITSREKKDEKPNTCNFYDIKTVELSSADCNATANGFSEIGANFDRCRQEETRSQETTSDKKRYEENGSFALFHFIHARF